MKIAIVTEALNTHSGSRAPIDLAISLAKLKNEVVIFAVRKNLDRKLKKEFWRKRIIVQILPNSKLESFVKLLFALKRIKPDIISFHGTLSSFFASKISRIPIVKTYYGTQLNAYFERIFPKETRLLDKFLNFLANQIILVKERVQFWLSDETVAISKFTSFEAEKLYKRKIPFVYLSSGILKNSTKISDIPKNFILSVSRFTPYKGFHELIKAVHDLPLIIVGSPQNKKYLNHLKKIKGPNCKILTNISDNQLSYLYKKCQFLASFDKLPFFGLPIVEAATFHKPAIAANFGAAKELIVDGKTGFVVNSPNEFITKAHLFFANQELSKKMGLQATKRVKVLFNWNKTANKYNKIFNQILAKNRNPRRITLTLGLIIVAGLVLRLLYLAHHDFWFDEAFSYFIAKQNLTNLIQATAADNNPPLYYLLLHFWLKIFGNSEIAQRFLSILFGILIIPTTYLLGKELFNNRIGLVASIFVAFSPLLIYFSAETRMYALVTFLGVLLALFFLKWLKKQKVVFSVSFVITLTTALYTNYYALLLLLPLNVITLVFRKWRSHFLKFLSLQILVLILFFPWIIIYFQNSHPAIFSQNTIIAVPATFASFILGGTGIITLRQFFQPDINLSILGIFLISIIFFGIIFLQSLTKLKNDANLQLVTVFLILPLTILAVINFIQPIFSVRGMILFVPFFYLIQAVQFSKFKKEFLPFALVTTITLLISISLIQLNQPVFKGPQLKKAAKTIFDSTAIAHTSVLTYYPFTYYHKDKVNNFLIGQNPLTEKTERLIGTKIKNSNDLSDKIILVEIKYGGDLVKLEELRNEIFENYEVLKVQIQGDIRLTYLLKKQAI